MFTVVLTALRRCDAMRSYDIMHAQAQPTKRLYYRAAASQATVERVHPTVHHLADGLASPHLQVNAHACACIRCKRTAARKCASESSGNGIGTDVRIDVGAERKCARLFKLTEHM